MRVVATAGHVDHGKSALVRALTGMEPDRYPAERDRGMTLDLGFVWTDLAPGRTVAFVDVPGHERFVPTMLAGAGPVPAVLLVVAADEGWMPQTAEHVAALDALRVRHAVLAISRADLAEPAAIGAVAADARARLAATGLAGAAAVPVSAVTGAGLAELRAALLAMLDGLPAADVDAPVRLWVDRSFTVHGAGTVVTGTLAAGTVRVGDELVLHAAGGTEGVRRRPVTVRGVQALGRPERQVAAVARVAVNLRGVAHREVRRGDALLTAGRWPGTASLDGRLERVPPGPDHPARLPGADHPAGAPGPDHPAGPDRPARLPGALTLHAGTAAVPVRVRPLAATGPDRVPGATHLRLALARALPLTAGDAVLLRDPGGHQVIGRFTVLDSDPPPLRGRGAAAARAAELARAGPVPDAAALLRARGMMRRTELAAVGAAPPPGAPAAGEWLLDPGRAGQLRTALAEAVRRHSGAPHLSGGPAVADLCRDLELPDPVVLRALLVAPLVIRDGRVVDPGAPAELPAGVADAVGRLAAELAGDPFAAPEAHRLAELGLGTRELAAAARAGLLLRVAEGVVLLPGCEQRAARILSGLPQPFTLGQARQALGTTRRVAVPLLQRLDRLRLTTRLPDDRRRTTAAASS
jgi:selenocysteine-specific elongation factor